MSRILVVEDDAGVRAMLERGLTVAGHEVTVAVDIGEARRRWARGDHELVLLDVMLPDGDGTALLAERRADGDTTPTVLLTAREEAELRDRAEAAGATAYLRKPFVYAELLDCVRRCTGS